MNAHNASRLARLSVVLFTLAAATAAAPATSIHLGPADPMAVDQPRVAVRMTDPTTGVVLGPEYANSFLLDTGAQGLIAAGQATSEMEYNGYTTVGTFYELGVGGTIAFDLSAEYDFEFAGTDGTPYVIGDARILSDPELSLGGFGGVVGIPAMVSRVTSLDLTNLLGDGGAFDFDYIGVDFADTLPAGGTDRYTAPVTLVDFEPPPQPDGPYGPTYGPVPMIPTRLASGPHAAGGPFILDTGAQLSMISTPIAIELGLDTDGDGDVWNEAVASTEISGVSGSIVVPIVAIEKLILPTDQGVDLVWTDLELVVYDIDPAIPGIFGSDLLTTGWIRAVFDTRDGGAFTQVHLDFRSDDDAHLVLDVNADYDLLTRTTSLPGDANEDGRVDIDDFAILKKRFGTTGAAWCDGDFDGDGAVELDDFMLLKQNFGAVGP
ncbi:MAG: aspartyl protease family protein [Planctomycetota bacterium]